MHTGTHTNLGGPVTPPSRWEVSGFIPGDYHCLFFPDFPMKNNIGISLSLSDTNQMAIPYDGGAGTFTQVHQEKFFFEHD